MTYIVTEADIAAVTSMVVNQTSLPDEATIQERVNRGRALLEEKGQPWRSAAMWPVFDFTQDYYCILGYCYGSYETGLQELCPYGTGGYSYQWAIYHGFQSQSLGIDEHEANMLQTCWTKTAEGQIDGTDTGTVKRSSH